MEGEEEAISSIESSLAIAFLGDLLAQEKIAEDEHERLRSVYSLVHQGVEENKENEKLLVKKLKSLENEQLAEQIALEKAKVQDIDSSNYVIKLENEKRDVQEELEESEKAATMKKFMLTETVSLTNAMRERKQELIEENEALVLPVFTELQRSIQEATGELQGLQEFKGREVRLKEELMKKFEMLEASIKEKRSMLEELETELVSFEAEPRRIQTQIDVFQSNVDEMSRRQSSLHEVVQGMDEEIEAITRRIQESQEVHRSLMDKIELHQETVESRHREIDGVQNQLNQQKAVHHQQMTRKAELELQDRESVSKHRHATDKLSLTRKELELFKKKKVRQEVLLNKVREGIPEFENELTDVQLQLTQAVSERRELKRSFDRKRGDTDVNIQKLLQQEGIERKTREDLSSLLEEVEALESDVLDWGLELQKQDKLQTMTSVQRDMKARDAMRANEGEREVKKHARVKELVVLELTRRSNEVNNRLKEFSALFDVVKAERNKFLNLIQSSEHVVAEFKDKIQMLCDELDILRNELSQKEHTLNQEKLSFQNAQQQRDHYRLDLNKVKHEYREKQSIIERHIQEISKLNVIINILEKHILALKSRYEDLTEERNHFGSQLIQRNDELCTLHEKTKLQFEASRAETLEINQLEDDLRVLDIHLKEYERQRVYYGNQTGELKELNDTIQQLRSQIQLEKEANDQLSLDLESTSNNDRCRYLGGEDLTYEELTEEMDRMEEKLNEKRQILLEKEMMLEEVTVVTRKMKQKAKNQRKESLDEFKRVNDYQARIRKLTKKMMSTVAELSLYQATSLKLEEEKERRHGEYDIMEEKMEQGEVPSEEAEKEWKRKERENLTLQDLRRRREEQRAMEREGMAGSLAEGSSSSSLIPPTATRDPYPENAPKSTAVQRPNAYVPEEMAIPVPYGVNAPFKPSESGAIMRHFRNPEPIDVEI